MPGDASFDAATIFDQFAADKRRPKLYRSQSQLTLRGGVGRRDQKGQG
jgi:hypothetical protein